MHFQERRAKNPLGITVCIFNIILMLCKKIIMINIKIYKQQGAEKHFFYLFQSIGCISSMLMIFFGGGEWDMGLNRHSSVCLIT